MPTLPTPATAAALPLVPAAPNPHFERLGGAPAVQRLAAAFYQAMDTRADAQTIRAMHAPDLAHSRQVLTAYLTEWMGGPRDYTPLRGTPMLRRRHQPFDIDASAQDAWMACMRQALAEVCSDPGLRTELEAAFAKVADVIRNTESGGAQRAHPGRPRALQPDSPAAPHTSSPTRSVP